MFQDISQLYSKMFLLKFVFSMNPTMVQRRPHHHRQALKLRTQIKIYFSTWISIKFLSWICCIRPYMRLLAASALKQSTADSMTTLGFWFWGLWVLSNICPYMCLLTISVLKQSTNLGCSGIGLGLLWTQERLKWRNCRLITKNPDYYLGWAILAECRQLDTHSCIFHLCSENFPNLTCYIKLKVHNFIT